MENKIKLIVTDVDGCLTPEQAEPYEMEKLMKIRDFNLLAQHENSPVPPITLCTGRPQPYTEAFLKMLHVLHPAICDNGGLIFQLEGDRYFYEEKFDKEWEEHVHRLKSGIRTKIFPRMSVEFQPGKETNVSLIARDEKIVDDLLNLIRQELANELKYFHLSATENHVNLVPHIFDKGTAFKRFVKIIGIDPRQMAGIGDSAADLAFMQQLGYPMCPQNASDDVKSKSVFVSQNSYVDGLIEIIGRCIAINRGEVAI